MSPQDVPPPEKPVTGAAPQQNLLLGGIIAPSNLDIQKTIYDEVVAQIRERANKILLWVIATVLAAALGAVVAITFDLNGQIYKAVGETGVSIKVYEIEINRLKDEVKDLKKKIWFRDCMEDKKVSDKGGCYHDN